MRHTIYVHSQALAKIPHLEAFLQAPVSRNPIVSSHLAAATWGRKVHRDQTEKWAKTNNKVLWRLEDGFIAYAQHPAIDKRPLSLIVDRTGIYYDASTSNDLENFLERDALHLTPEQLQRAQALRERVITLGLSKYNHAHSRLFSLTPSNKRRILLVDQTLGDRSIHYGGASLDHFQLMLESALTDHPEAEIWAKVHPDVLLGVKKGCLKLEGTRVHVLADDCNVIRLLEAFDEVYVVSSQVGFEALLLGKKVHCFGSPFYSGWGLTIDRQTIPRRKARLNLQQLVYGALIHYPRYVHPETGERCEPELIFNYLSLAKQKHFGPVREFHAIGFSRWKRAFVKSFVSAYGARVRFHRSPKSFREKPRLDLSLLVWGSKFPQHRQQWQNQGYQVTRVEDGFVRSVGLGSDLKRPASLVFDRQGLYYDARSTSDLEHLLAHASFSPEILEIARRAHAEILNKQISKYNVQSDHAFTSEQRADALLAIGQVAGDASLAAGLSLYKDDQEFLHDLRQRYPDRWIIYKPHPDVLASNRQTRQPAPTDYDEIIDDRSLAACLGLCDEVHVMTSLSGFEALLRGKTVYTYGLPFYAGWGLTVDALTCPRRHRRLRIEELIAGSLILYPYYFDWRLGGPTSLLSTLAMIGQEKAQGQPEMGVSAWKRFQRKCSFALEAIWGG